MLIILKRMVGDLLRFGYLFSIVFAGSVLFFRGSFGFINGDLFGGYTVTAQTLFMVSLSGPSFWCAVGQEGFESLLCPERPDRHFTCCVDIYCQGSLSLCLRKL
jgi:hypothetical protein